MAQVASAQLERDERRLCSSGDAGIEGAGEADALQRGLTSEPCLCDLVQVEERFDTEFERLGQVSKEEEGVESDGFLPGLVKPNPVLPNLSSQSGAPTKPKVGDGLKSSNSPVRHPRWSICRTSHRRISWTVMWRNRHPSRGSVTWAHASCCPGWAACPLEQAKVVSLRCYIDI